MAIPTLIANLGALPAGSLPITPSFAALALLSCVVVVMIYAYQPPLPQNMVFAFVPWIVAGALLSALATEVQYPSYLVPLFTAPGSYVTSLLIPGLAWVAMLNFSISRQKLPAYHHYIGTMGVGAMTILWVALVVQVGADHLMGLIVLLVVPIIAFLSTGLIGLTIGFWSPDFVDYAAITGGFVVFAALMNGIATTTTVAALGASAHTVFSATVQEFVTVVAPGGVAGVDVTFLWVWLFLLANIAIGIHVATRLAPYADTSPRAVNAMLSVLGIAGFALGIDRLLLMVVG